MRVGLFHRKSSQCTQIFPSRTSRPCQDCVCHRVSNNEDADPHTILNALLVLAMIERITVLLPECTLQTKTVSEDEEENDVSSRRPLYCSRAGSDVMGFRRPTSVVFILYASDKSHAEGVPHSDP